jgi:hypothetical protein
VGSSEVVQEEGVAEVSEALHKFMEVRMFGCRFSDGLEFSKGSCPCLFSGCSFLTN